MLNVLGLINLQYNKVCNTNTKYSSFILHQSWYSNCNSFRKVILQIYFEQKEEKEGNVQIKIKNEIFVVNVKINLEMNFLLACVSKKSFCFLTKANCSDWQKQKQIVQTDLTFMQQQSCTNGLKHPILLQTMEM
jgi:hypothetical protein